MPERLPDWIKKAKSVFILSSLYAIGLGIRSD